MRRNQVVLKGIGETKAYVATRGRGRRTEITHRAMSRRRPAYELTKRERTWRR